MRSFIFLCDLSTEQECLDRMLFGTTPGESVRLHYSEIDIGDRLFLYNFEVGVLRGPFKAETACVNNLEPSAWKKGRRAFPWQVRVTRDGGPIGEVRADAFAGFIPLTSTRVGLLPPPELTEEQSDRLLALLRCHL